MELNYTPQKKDGSISIEKAVEINEAFQISRQFWSHQVNSGVMHDPHSFINTVPHMSFVWGEQNVNFLRARYAALQQSTLFRGINTLKTTRRLKSGLRWSWKVVTRTRKWRRPVPKLVPTLTMAKLPVSW